MKSLAWTPGYCQYLAKSFIGHVFPICRHERGVVLFSLSQPTKQKWFFVHEYWYNIHMRFAEKLSNIKQAYFSRKKSDNQNTYFWRFPIMITDVIEIVSLAFTTTNFWRFEWIFFLNNFHYFLCFIMEPCFASSVLLIKL